jgi:hypothetical protein
MMGGIIVFVCWSVVLEVARFYVISMMDWNGTKNSIAASVWYLPNLLSPSMLENT